MNAITLIAMLTILGLAFIQNISFSIVSRSRNRNNMKYHLIAAAFSNSIWFLTFRHLVRGEMGFILFMPYVVGTMIGSLCGVRISMFFEKLLGATADGHLKKPVEMATKIINRPTIEDLYKKNNEQTIADLIMYWKYRNNSQPIHEAPMSFESYVIMRRRIAREELICPVCHKHPIASGRDTCVDCSH